MARNEKVRVLMIDNYDSFTYNLVQYLGELGAGVTVKRNDAIDVAGIRALHPAAVVISPGPCTPAQAGISLKLLREMAGEVPILGVCLGLQCIGEASLNFNGKVRDLFTAIRMACLFRTDQLFRLLFELRQLRTPSSLAFLGDCLNARSCRLGGIARGVCSAPHSLHRRWRRVRCARGTKSAR